MEELLEFEELGLTKNEAKSYQVLIEHGKLGAGEISKFSGVPYSRIYDVLFSLEQKGMIKIVPEKSKKFVPLSPDEFTKLIEQKKENLNKLSKKIKEMKKKYNVQNKNPVILGYGKNAFYKIVKEMKVPLKYSYSIKYTSEYRPEWERNYLGDIQQGVDSKNLVRFDKGTAENIKKWVKVGRKNMRVLDNEGIAMGIQDDQVMLGLIKSNVTLLISDKPLAKIMKKMFLETYKNAEEIK